MMAGHALIDKAVAMCGSRYRLHKLTGISQATLSVVYAGKAPLSPTMAAKIAEVAGVDASRAAVVALIEAEKDPAERAVLERVFFRAAAQVMLFIFIIGALLEPSPASARPADHLKVALGTSTDTSGLYIMLSIF